MNIIGIILNVFVWGGLFYTADSFSYIDFSDILGIYTNGYVFPIAPIALLTLLPQLSVLVRRLHDSGRSGVWLLIALFPIIGFFVIFVFTLLEGDRVENEYGPVPAK